MERLDKTEGKKDSHDSNQSEAKGKQSDSKKNSSAMKNRSFYSMIKWSVVFAGITTYTHFFGFSFVKGKLQGAGFYSSDISLDVNETLHEAAAATQMGLYSIAKHFFSDENFQMAIVFAISLPVAYLTLVGLAYLERTRKVDRAKEVIQNIRSRFRNKYSGAIKKTLISTALAGVGFVLPYLVSMAMVTFISVLWLGMSMGQNIGETYTKNLIEGKVCKPLPEAKADVVRECMAMRLSDGSVLSGRILHQEKSKLFFLTNNGSYQINEKLEVQYSSCFYRIKENADVPTEMSPNCMARCELSCKKGIKNIDSSKK